MKLRKNNQCGYVIVSTSGCILRWYRNLSHARRSAKGKTVATLPDERSRPFKIGDRVTINNDGDVEHDN